jgi:hypothetical protein
LGLLALKVLIFGGLYKGIFASAYFDDNLEELERFLY